MTENENECGTTPINEASAPKPTPEPAAGSEPEAAPEVELEDPEPSFAYSEGDMIFIHGNNGKYVAEVEKSYPDYAAAEADHDLSFQTITKKGPLYDYNVPHYLCRLANPGKSLIGACETDTTLKARYVE